ncbi:MAG: hypothetical protein L6R42_006907 [Xanthoria sp. 1 TBL-2021]|nr:MAG: hypothetical protein L6R42_006907 [Xanthoria sp. 1 TBL-2021]
MTTFITDLFTSIFTPGPTPTLLVATNVSFAALQLVFLVLLVLTYSIHFIILSFLCGGLWWSINWFAAELEVAKQIEKEKKEREQAEESDNDEEKHWRKRERSAEDSGTETEGGEDRVSPAEEHRRVSMATTLQPEDAEGGIRKRRSLGSSTGDLSTDSEWDKVEEADTQR